MGTSGSTLRAVRHPRQPQGPWLTTRGIDSHDVATRIKHPDAAREGCEAGWKEPDGEESAAASLGPWRHLFCARRGLNGDMADTGPHGGGHVRRNSHTALHAETSSLLARPRAPVRFPVRCSPNPPITASGSCARSRRLHLESDGRGRPRGGPKVPTTPPKASACHAEDVTLAPSAGECGHGQHQPATCRVDRTHRTRRSPRPPQIGQASSLL